MHDLSGFGLIATVIADKTFPKGVQITAWADDSDPFDSPAITITDKATGLNGDLVYWSKTNPIPVSFSVIPGSQDDIDLAYLFDANRAAKGKNASKDAITINVLYPDGTTKVYSQGVIDAGMPTSGVASTQRLKTKTYSFVFENMA